MAGAEVQQVQERLDELGFFVGEIDGQFGPLFEQALWAYQKLVMNVPRDEVTSILTDEIWQDMQRPIRIEPMRWHSKGEATRNHAEIYLPSQVAVFFVDDEPAMIVHISSGDGKEWREVVTIDPGEFGNENGTEPLERREIGVSVTPGGVFRFERMVEGLRNSALGGMWDPAYFNYGIAMHGALNVPLYPASHGCIRMSQTAGRTFHQYIDVGDQVFVWDGVKEPEYYAQNPGAAYPRGQLPIFNRIDHTYTTTTSSTIPTTTVAPTVGAHPAVAARRRPDGGADARSDAAGDDDHAASVSPIRDDRRPSTTEFHRRVRRSDRRRNATTLSRRRPRPRDRGRGRATPSVHRRRTPRARCRRHPRRAPRMTSAPPIGAARTPATRPSWRRSRPIATRSTAASERTRR